MWRALQGKAKAVDPQALRRARSRAAAGRTLPLLDASGPYGEAFWARVAAGVRGRTAADCLDGFLASEVRLPRRSAPFWGSRLDCVRRLRTPAARAPRVRMIGFV